MNSSCIKCGAKEFRMSTTIIPEQREGLKLELGKYYLKTCCRCGFTEIYSAKVVDKSGELKPAH